jgi:hypothetical protein
MTFRAGGQDRVLLNASGNLGVGTLSPSERLHVAGNLRVDGSIKLPSTLRWLSVAPCAFQPTTSGSGYQMDQTWIWSPAGSTISLAAPVEFPDRASTSEVKGRFYDAAVSGGVTLWVHRTDFENALVTTLVLFDTASFSGGATTLTLPVNPPSIVHNSSDSDQLTAPLFGSNAQLGGVRVRYEVSSPLP